MPYDPNSLSALSYANGFTLWAYNPPHTAKQIETPLYWQHAAHMCRVGDRIHVNASDAAADFVVTANRGNTLRVERMTPWIAFAPIDDSVDYPQFEKRKSVMDERLEMMMSEHKKLLLESLAVQFYESAIRPWSSSKAWLDLTPEERELSRMAARQVISPEGFR